MEQKNKQELVKNEQNIDEFVFPEKVFNKEADEEKNEPKVAEDVVEKMFNAAMVSTVQNDVELQEKIVDTAKETIHNKTEALKHQAEAESKEAYFRSNESACDCFGFVEKSTEKWAVTFMKFWHRVMTAIWLFLGCFTYAPVTYIAQKLSIFIKKSWLAIVVAILIYLACATSPVWLGWLNSIGA
jgi:hypothetical protein